MADDLSRWRAALKGQKLDLGARGDPPCGYFRRLAASGRWEAIAIWRENDGTLSCWRNIYGDGLGMEDHEIDDLFQQPNMFAIPYEIFSAVQKGGEWPEIYQTKFTTADIKAGIIWTEEWAKNKLAQMKAEKINDDDDISRHEIGGNFPPEEMTPDQTLRRKLENKHADCLALIRQWGGAPRNQAEADLLGSYVTAFGAMAIEAQRLHDVEKEPILIAGRAIDAKWFGPIRDAAQKCKDEALAIVRHWKDGEDQKRQEEALAATEEARKLAKRQEIDTGHRVDVEEIKPEPVKVSTVRGGGATPRKWIVKDYKGWAEYLLNLEGGIPTDLKECLDKLATKMGKAGVRHSSIE